MKVLIKLLLPLSMIAQQPRTFTPEMRLYNFEKIQFGREYKYRYLECRDLFNEQQLRVEALADSARVRDSRNKELQSINNGLLEEAYKLQYDLGQLKSEQKWYRKPWLWFVVGVVGGGWIVSEIKN